MRFPVHNIKVGVFEATLIICTITFSNIPLEVTDIFIDIGNQPFDR